MSATVQALPFWIQPFYSPSVIELTAEEKKAASGILSRAFGAVRGFARVHFIAPVAAVKTIKAPPLDFDAVAGGTQKAGRVLSHAFTAVAGFVRRRVDAGIAQAKTDGLKGTAVRAFRMAVKAGTRHGLKSVAIAGLSAAGVASVGAALGAGMIASGLVAGGASYLGNYFAERKKAFLQNGPAVKFWDGTRTKKAIPALLAGVAGGAIGSAFAHSGAGQAFGRFVRGHLFGGTAFAAEAHAAMGADTFTSATPPVSVPVSLSLADICEHPAAPEMHGPAVLKGFAAVKARGITDPDLLKSLQAAQDPDKLAQLSSRRLIDVAYATRKYGLMNRKDGFAFAHKLAEQAVARNPASALAKRFLADLDRLGPRPAPVDHMSVARRIVHQYIGDTPAPLPPLPPSTAAADCFFPLGEGTDATCVVRAEIVRPGDSINCIAQENPRIRVSAVMTPQCPDGTPAVGQNCSNMPLPVEDFMGSSGRACRALLDQERARVSHIAYKAAPHLTGTLFARNP